MLPDAPWAFSDPETVKRVLIGVVGSKTTIAGISRTYTEYEGTLSF
jgi:hypothetical protein